MKTFLLCVRLTAGIQNKQERRKAVERFLENRIIHSTLK